MDKKERTDKGVFTWGAFTAIMIIVVCAAVLVFVFHVKIGDNTEKPAQNTNVITVNEIDKGVIKTEDGNTVTVDNSTEEATNETTNETIETEEVKNTTNEVTTENTVEEVVDNTVQE